MPPSIYFLLCRTRRARRVDTLHSFTMGGAFASFEEDRKGSISPGKLADFVVLSGDPSRTPPDEVRNIRVLCTFIGGELVYSAEGEECGDARSQ